MPIPARLALPDGLWAIYFGDEPPAFTNHHLAKSRDLNFEIVDEEPPF